MEAELEQINKIMADEISAIRDKYNKQKREVRKKYKELEKKNNPKPKRVSIPKSVKDQLWDNTFGSTAGEGKCYVCSDTINSKKFDCGHIVAVCQGGTNDISNLKAICSTCNKSMGTKNMDDFKQEYFNSKLKNARNVNFNKYDNIDYSKCFNSPVTIPSKSVLRVNRGNSFW